MPQQRTGAQPGVRQWFALASEGAVIRRACLYAAVVYAAVVGPILIFINHGDELLAGQISKSMLLKMGLTMMVPYLVSTFSSVAAMRG